MGKTLYVQCESGISGDMFVAALLDLGAREDVLRAALASLPVDGYDVVVSRVHKSGLDACDFAVVLDEAHGNHDHDMEYLHGPSGPREPNAQDAPEAELDTLRGAHVARGIDALFAGGDEARDDPSVHGERKGSHERPSTHHGHDHHDHVHDDHDHHGHRGMAEIAGIIQAGRLSERARATALAILGVIARAEAKAHGVPLDQVHFHEVGAVDSIVDVVSAAVCLDDLDITDVIVTHLCEGMGTVRCQHGILPVPVPAVANIVADANIQMHIMDAQGEFVTPTGAGIVAAIRTADALPERFAIVKTGLGAGKRTYERPSLLRALLIEPAQEASAADVSTPQGGPRVWKLETEVDDCSGEALGHAMERLHEQGAREVHFVPVFMKKNRPAYQIQVICDEEHIAALEQVLFEETTTIGIRRAAMERTVLLRHGATVSTRLGYAQVKEVVLPNGSTRAYPEQASVAQLAADAGVSYQQALRAVMAAIETSSL